MNPNAIVAYLVLFSATGFLFLFAALLFGRFFRSYAGTPEKLQTYECGEPSVGSSYVQFDLRFYVVALVFIIFEVEVAFFFPWATIFGKATQIKALAAAEQVASPGDTAKFQEAIAAKYRELGDAPPVQAGTTGHAIAATAPSTVAPSTARTLAVAAMLDMAAFFAILLIGFAYVWNRGDLDWVRAMGRQGLGQQSDRPLVEVVAGSASRRTSS